MRGPVASSIVPNTTFGASCIEPRLSPTLLASRPITLAARTLTRLSHHRTVISSRSPVTVTSSAAQLSAYTYVRRNPRAPHPALTMSTAVGGRTLRSRKAPVEPEVATADPQEPTPSPTPQVDASRTAMSPVTFRLEDPDGQWKARGTHLLLALKANIKDVVITSFRPTPSGFLLRVCDNESFATAFREASAFSGCSLTLEKPQAAAPRVFEVTLRGVPTCLTTEEILQDLQENLGPNVRTVRRLHASTDGKLDMDRPQPRVVVTVLSNESAQRVASATIFGVLRCKASAPRPVEDVPQCRRCFAWGHRAGQCKAQRRCIRCGNQQHGSDACSRPREDRQCFACGGQHAVTWAGCPKRRELLRCKRTPQPLNTPPVSFPPSRTENGRSFAAVAASSVSPAPIPRIADGTTPPAGNAANRHPSVLSPLGSATQTPLAQLTTRSESQRRPVAERLSETSRSLEEAVIKRQEAKAENEVLQTISAKRRFQAAARRCTILRRRQKKLQAERARVRTTTAAEQTVTKPEIPTTSHDEEVKLHASSRMLEQLETVDAAAMMAALRTLMSILMDFMQHAPCHNA